MRNFRASSRSRNMEKRGIAQSSSTMAVRILPRMRPSLVITVLEVMALQLNT